MGQIKNIKLHIVTDIKIQIRKMSTFHKGFLLVCSRQTASLFTRSGYSSMSNTFHLQQSRAVLLPGFWCRNHRNSNRAKRKRAINEKNRLEREMEKKYGIERAKHHDHKAWWKKNYVAEFLAF